MRRRRCARRRAARPKPDGASCTGVVKHVFTHFPLELTVFVAQVPRRAAAPKGARWVKLRGACRRGLAERDAQGACHALDNRGSAMPEADGRRTGRRACAIPTRWCARSTSASTNTVCRSPASSGCSPARAGARARSGSATGAICCGATCPATASGAGTRRPARSAYFRKPSNNANGNTRDRQGRLITCEHLTPPRHAHRI